MNILCIESFCQQKTQNRTLLFGSKIKHVRHFDYWNQPLNMRMRVCYLDCHEAGLCCYLVIHMKNLLRPLQPFYFYLWPIYCISLILQPHISPDFHGQSFVYDSTSVNASPTKLKVS
jgi:hypothetical protein